MLGEAAQRVRVAQQDGGVDDVGDPVGVADGAGGLGGGGRSERHGSSLRGGRTPAAPGPTVTWSAGIDDGPCVVRGTCPSADGACIASQAVRFPTARTCDATTGPGPSDLATPGRSSDRSALARHGDWGRVRGLRRPSTSTATARRSSSATASSRAVRSCCSCMATRARRRPGTASRRCWSRPACPSSAPTCPATGARAGRNRPHDHAPHAKTAHARRLRGAMRALGVERFAVVGHDRGSYVAFRLALDHPEAVTRVALLDCVPIVEHLERCDARFATAWWHWFFFARPEVPERVIDADPLAWYAFDDERMGAENAAECRAAVQDPAVVRGMLEDYRAGLTVDADEERAARAAGLRVTQPLLVLWSLRDDLEELHGDPRLIWRAWADDVSGHGLDAGHHVAEEAPDELTAALVPFLLPACDGTRSIRAPRRVPSSAPSVSPRPQRRLGAPHRADRLLDQLDDHVGVVDEHPPGDAQHRPALEDEVVLPPSVALEELRVGLVQPTVDLDHQPERREAHVQEVVVAADADGQVGLPPRDARRPEQTVAETLGGRPRLVARVEEDGAPVAVARAGRGQPERLVQTSERALPPSAAAGRSRPRRARRRGPARSGRGTSPGSRDARPPARAGPGASRRRTPVCGSRAQRRAHSTVEPGRVGQNVTCAAVRPTSTASGAHLASAASRDGALAARGRRGRVHPGQDGRELAVPHQPRHGSGQSRMVPPRDHPVALQDGPDLVGESHPDRTSDRCCQSCRPDGPGWCHCPKRRSRCPYARSARMKSTLRKSGHRASQK